MVKFSLASICIALISLTVCAQQANDPKQIAAVKAAIAKIGIGPDSLVRITRYGKPKVKGFINKIGDDSFEVLSTEKGSVGVLVTISYSEVLSIKGKGVESVGSKATGIGVKGLRGMFTILRGACFGPISRCSP